MIHESWLIKHNLAIMWPQAHVVLLVDVVLRLVWLAQNSHLVILWEYVLSLLGIEYTSL